MSRGMSSDLVRLSAAELGAKIAAKEVSSTEVDPACLDQIAETDDQYHAFLHVAEEQALAEAARIDAAVAAGESLPSPLAGVPLALKDVFTTTDMPTTCGSKILEGWTLAVRRHRHRAAARGGHPDPGQDEHGRVRDGLAPPRTPPTARPAIRGTSTGCLADRAAAARRRSPRSRRRWPSGRTRAGRSASPPR